VSTDAQRIILEATAAPDQVLHLDENLFMRQRFHDEVIGTGLQHAQPGGFVQSARDRDDRRPHAGQTELADNIQIAQPVFRQAEQNNIVIIEFHQIERFPRVICFIDDGEAGAQKGGQQVFFVCDCLKR
jgi:hypothetical protein